VYFRGWHSNAPPRWGQHWGHEWEQRRGGWDRWNRSSVPARAPRPSYQRQYSGERYPQRVEQQHSLRSRSYRYQPRDTVVRQHIKQHAGQNAPAPAQRGRQQEQQLRGSRQQGAPADTRPQPPQRGGENIQRSAPPQEHRQQPGAVQQREQQAPRAQGREQKPHDRGEAQEQKERGHGQDRDEERGRGRNN